MMRKICFLILLSVKVNAQLPTLDWVRSAGTSTASEAANSTTTDGTGNVYITGTYFGICDIDPGPGTFNLTSYGSSDIYILKLDVTGNFIWAGSIGSPGNDVYPHIDLDGAGNIYIMGIPGGVCDFDPGPGTYTLSSANGGFITKLDPSGNLVWAKTYSYTTGPFSYSNYRPYCLDLDATGNVYIGGLFGDIIDFDPGPTTFTMGSYSSSGSFISKLDQNGNFLWAKSFMNGGPLMCVKTDPSNNVYSGGLFGGSVDFNPGPGTFSLTSAGGPDVFISKLDQNGNFLWARSMGGPSFDGLTSIGLDASNNVYSTGSYDLTADFDPGPAVANLVSSGNWDIFISKLDASGNFIWAKSQSGTNNEMGNSLVLDAAGSVYISGYFSGTVDFDPAPSTYTLNAASNTTFISKLDPSGNFQWAFSLDASLGGDYDAVSVDGVGNLYIVGSFTGTVDFDPGAGTYTLTSAGNNDLYILKLNQAPLAVENNTIKKNSLVIFPNPTSGIFNVELNAECDIIISDIFGQIILHDKKNKGIHSINLIDAPCGIYFVEFISDKNQETFKLIKE